MLFPKHFTWHYRPGAYKLETVGKESWIRVPAESATMRLKKHSPISKNTGLVKEFVSLSGLDDYLAFANSHGLLTVLPAHDGKGEQASVWEKEVSDMACLLALHEARKTGRGLTELLALQQRNRWHYLGKAAWLKEIGDVEGEDVFVAAAELLGRAMDQKLFEVPIGATRIPDSTKNGYCSREKTLRGILWHQLLNAVNCGLLFRQCGCCPRWFQCGKKPKRLYCSGTCRVKACVGRNR